MFSCAEEVTQGFHMLGKCSTTKLDLSPKLNFKMIFEGWKREKRVSIKKKKLEKMESVCGRAFV